MSLRDSLNGFVPPWLANLLPVAPSYGFRTLWALALQADAFVDWVLEGTRAAVPGVGTPTALPAIARTRAVARGRVEDDESHVARLIQWQELHEARGTMRGMTREVQNFLGKTNGGQFHTVMCVSRRNTWGIRRENGAYEYYDASDIGATHWDYDSVSSPERARCWADMWIIVVPPAYTPHLSWQWPSLDSGFGHDSPQSEVVRLREIVEAYRAGRTVVRGIIWSPKYVPAGYPLAGALCFDPLPGGPSPFLPDGTWGKWSKRVGGIAVASRPEWLRFWEF